MSDKDVNNNSLIQSQDKIEHILRHEKPFTTTFLNDTCSQIKNPTALGVYVYISCQSESWVVCKTHLKNHFTIGRDALEKCFTYLKNLGLLIITPVRDGRGRIVKWDTLRRNRICTSPISITPEHWKPVLLTDHQNPENPYCGVQDTENPYCGTAFKEPSVYAGSVQNPEKPECGKTTTNTSSSSKTTTNYLEDSSGSFSFESGNNKKLQLDISRLERYGFNLTHVCQLNTIAEQKKMLSVDMQKRIDDFVDALDNNMHVIKTNPVSLFMGIMRRGDYSKPGAAVADNYRQTEKDKAAAKKAAIEQEKANKEAFKNWKKTLTENELKVLEVKKPTNIHQFDVFLEMYFYAVVMKSN